MQSVSEMAASERTDMLRQLIEMFRCANFSENIGDTRGLGIPVRNILFVCKFFE